MTVKFLFPIIASISLMTSSHAVKEEAYQQCITDAQRKFSECQKEHNHNDCDTQRKSDQESCEKLLAVDSQQDGSEWTHEDDEILRSYSVNKDGFLENITTYNECTDKITEIDYKIQSIHIGSQMSDDIKDTLHKLCKIEFSDAQSE